MWSHRDNETKMISELDTCRECGSYIPGCGWEPLCDDCARDVHEQRVSVASTDCSAINIIFDGPPGHDAGRFVEVETDDGRSINAGEWIKRPDGLWALRITHLPNTKS